VTDRAAPAAGSPLAPRLGPGGGELEPAGRAGRDPNAGQQVQRRAVAVRGVGCCLRHGMPPWRRAPGGTFSSRAGATSGRALERRLVVELAALAGPGGRLGAGPLGLGSGRRSSGPTMDWSPTSRWCSAWPGPAPRRGSSSWPPWPASWLARAFDGRRGVRLGALTAGAAGRRRPRAGPGNAVGATRARGRGAGAGDSGQGLSAEQAEQCAAAVLAEQISEPASAEDLAGQDVVGSAATGRVLLRGLRQRCRPSDPAALCTSGRQRS
jgi:hypothetical protein